MMKKDCRDALLLAFEKDLLPAPVEPQKWLVLNARTVVDDPFGSAEVRFEQGFRPEFLALQAQGCSVDPQLETDLAVDHSIVFAGRVRRVNEENFIRAWNQTKTGGSVIVAGDKTAGIASLRKWAGAKTEVTDSFSKHHAMVFWAKKTEGTRFEPGGANLKFSAQAPDGGSTLLTRYFDNRIGGSVADFGAGDGYLTQALLEKSTSVQSVDLMEAEWSAIESARKQLSGSSVPVFFLWIDIIRELKKKPYDWVIMNPPFHHGLHGTRQTDPELGKKFIQLAATTLIPGGRLLMVANRNLPYEETLKAAYQRVTKLTDEGGYKVFEAVR